MLFISYSLDLYDRFNYFDFLVTFLTYLPNFNNTAFLVSFHIVHYFLLSCHHKSFVRGQLRLFLEDRQIETYKIVLMHGHQSRSLKKDK